MGSVISFPRKGSPSIFLLNIFLLRSSQLHMISVYLYFIVISV
jgi:hypothetical protein